MLRARLVAASSRANLEGRGQRWSEGSASPSRLKSAEAAFVVRAVDAPAGVRVSRAKAGLQPAKATSEAADELPRPLPSPASLRHQQARQRGESTGGAWGEGRGASCRGRLLAHRQRTERARRAQQAASAPRGANKMAPRPSRKGSLRRSWVSCGAAQSGSAPGADGAEAFGPRFRSTWAPAGRAAQLAASDALHGIMLRACTP